MRMKAHCSITLIVFVFLSVRGLAKNPGDKSSKPNIVLLFVDDWAWTGTPVRMDDNMPNSQMPLLQMPNLEKLARQGMTFRNAYSAAPQCSPSRVALQTGQSSPRNGYTVYTLTAKQAMEELNQAMAIPVQIKKETIWLRTDIPPNGIKLLKSIGMSVPPKIIPQNHKM